MATGGVAKSRSAPSKTSPIVASKSTPEGVRITAKTGSITEEKVDILVNTTQRELRLDKGAISKAISQAAGATLQKECTQKAAKGVDYGQFVETGPGKLPCQVVYHCVIAKWTSEGEKTLRNALSACLQKGHKDKRKSIAMPAIGTGNLGFPHQKVAAIINEEVTKFSKNNKRTSLTDIRVVVLKDDTIIIKALKAELAKKTTTTDGGKTVVAGKVAGSLINSILPARASTREGIVVTVKAGSIIDEQVDVIINSTSRDLNLTAGAISSTILRAAGGLMQEECRRKAPDGLSPGEVVETTAGNLACKSVYHGPITAWNNGEGEKGLRGFVRTSMQWADEDNKKTMAIPPIGTGKLKYPRAMAARAIFDEIRQYSSANPKTPLRDIRLVLYEETMEAVVAFTTQLKQLNPAASSDEEDDDDDPDEANYKSGLAAAAASASVVSSISTPDGVNILLKLGSIIGEKVDVIVNVTGKDMRLNKGTLSKLVLDAAGDVIQTECDANAPNGLDYGQIVATSGGKMDCKHIYHCCLTSWNNGDNEKYLRTALISILNKAHDGKMTSLAMPAMGTGILKFPPSAVVNAMLQEISAFSQINKRSPLREIRLIVHDKDAPVVNAFKSRIDEVKSQSMVFGPNTQKHMTAQTMQPLPDTWATMEMDTTYVPIPLPPTDPEYTEVAEQFASHDPKNKDDIIDSIVQVQRIQNPLLYEMYGVLRKQMMRRTQTKPNCPVERILYHGTTAEAVENINARGFNRSYCGKNCVKLGEGVYFAVKPSVAMQDEYSPPDASDMKYVYHSRVLTGEYTKGSYSCLEPPMKDKVRNVRYDSVVDDEAKPGEFVVFYDAQAFPEYLITLDI